MPTLTPKSTTACTSSEPVWRRAHGHASTCLLTVAAALIGIGCDRFPRDNPIDPGARGDLVVVLGAGESTDPDNDPILVNDSQDISRFNNGNQVVETRETLELTIPLSIMRSSGELSAAATLETKSSCVAGIETKIPVEISFPRTTGSTSSELSAGPFEVVMGDSEACSADEEIDFVLKLRLIQEDITLEVPFELRMRERDGMVTVKQVVIDDEESDRQGDLDPGEKVGLYITLENEGVLLREVEGYVSEGGLSCVARVRIGGSPTGRLQFFDILPNETSIAQGTLELTADSTCNSTRPVEFVFVVEDNTKQQWLIPIEIQVKDPAINPMPTN